MTIRPNQDYQYTFRFTPIAEKDIHAMMENSKTGLTDKLVESDFSRGTANENFQQNCYEYEVPVVSMIPFRK